MNLSNALRLTYNWICSALKMLYRTCKFLLYVSSLFYGMHLYKIVEEFSRLISSSCPYVENSKVTFKVMQFVCP